MDLSIVILSYNTPDLVISCLRSLETQYLAELEKEKVEILVLDNASSDDSFKKISEYGKGKDFLKVYKSPTNLGFGQGCNLGARKTHGKFVLFLNSDTVVENRGLLEMVEEIEKNPQMGVLGGRLTKQDGTPQKSTGRFYTLFNFLVMIIFGERAAFLKSSPKEFKKVDWVSGGCMMVSRKIFQEIGGFDKDFFMYLEDLELCFREKKNGFDTYFYPNVSIKHVGQGSSSRKFAVVSIYKGLLLFYKKFFPSWQYQIVRICLWLKANLVYIIGRLTGNKYYTDTYGEALKLFR